MLKIIIADDHYITRNGGKSLLVENGYQVVGEAEDGLEAWRLIERLRPDMLVTDLTMPNMTGVELIRQTKQHHPHIKIVVLSMLLQEDVVAEVIQLGAHGFVSKNGPATELLDAVKAVNEGRHFLGTPFDLRGIDYFREFDLGRDQIDLLSPRERQILQMISEGRTNDEMAQILIISRRTVEAHRKRLMEKLEAKHVSDLIRFAYQNGVISLD